VVECVREPENCLRSDQCECRDLYVVINRQIKDTLNRFTLADLEQGRIKL